MEINGYIEKEILWINLWGWIMLIGIGVIAVILYFRYYKPIEKIKAEAVNTYFCFGEWRFIFIFIWTGIMICFYLYQIFVVMVRVCKKHVSRHRQTRDRLDNFAGSKIDTAAWHV